MSSFFIFNRKMQKKTLQIKFFINFKINIKNDYHFGLTQFETFFLFLFKLNKLFVKKNLKLCYIFNEL